MYKIAVVEGGGAGSCTPVCTPEPSRLLKGVCDKNLRDRERERAQNTNGKREGEKNYR